MTPFADDFLDSPAGKFFKAKVAAALTRDLEKLVDHLFGKPVRRGKYQWRFAHAVEVVMTGLKRGSWVSRSGNGGGGPLQMIAFDHHCDLTSAWEWAGHWTGIEPEAQAWTRAERQAWAERQKRERQEREAKHAAAKAQDEAERIARAREIWEASVPIAGTLGEQYWCQVRGIPAPGGWPHDVVRFDASKRAVVFAATTDDGDVQATHSIFLRGDGHNVLLSPDHNGRRRKKKITHGVRDGAVVRFPGPVTAPLQLAEGCETGASGWAATGYATWIILGPLAQAKPPRGRIVIGLRDDDAPGSPADRELEKSLAAWRKDGARIELATPWPERRGDKSDFNDLLRQDGLDAVRQRIRLAELAAHGLKPAPAPFTLPSATVAAIHADIGGTLTDFFSRRWDDVAPRVLLAAATGTGKTELLGKRLPDVVYFDKAKERAHRVVIAVPDHKLARQIAQRYRQLATDAKVELSVEVYEGRGNPFSPPSGGREYLCEDLPAVGLALEAGADITATVCGSSKSATRCRFRDSCGYFAQVERCRNADIVIVAQNFLFEPLPQALLNNISAVIIEEDPSGHGIGTTTLPIAVFDEKALRAHPVLHKDDGEPDHYLTEELAALYRQLGRALTDANAGLPLAEALEYSGLAADDIAEARKLSWKRKIDDNQMRPGMPLDERRAAALIAAKINPLLRPMHALLSALQEVAKQSERFDFHGEAEPPPISFEGNKVIVHRLRETASWLKSLPVLIVSATARPDLMRRFFPTLEHKAPPAPALPHQTVRQYLGAFGKSGISRTKRDELVAQVSFEAALGRSVLVICHMRDEPAFAGIPGVRTLHHGLVAGDDDFGDVDLVVQIGGPFAPPAEIARLASAEAGRLVEPAKPVRSPCVGLLADGSGAQFERFTYADPAAQAVHAGIYDQSFVQGGLGRGRGINRSAATPLEIRILGNVPLPVPVHSIDRWRPINRIGKMLLRGAVHLNAADMHSFYPDLFPSPAAAAQAVHRWGGRDAMRGEARRLARQFLFAWVEIAWQPNGQGHKPRTSFAALTEIAAVRAEALRQFPDGLAAWTATPLPAAPLTLWAAEEHDTGGKEASFPPVSLSSSASGQKVEAAAGAVPSDQPRAPPDG